MTALNKYFELYSRDTIEDAFNIGYQISKALGIDLLEATISNDHKWIDGKVKLINTNFLTKMNEIFLRIFVLCKHVIPLILFAKCFQKNYNKN